MQSPPEYVPLYRRGSSEERVLREPLLKEEVDRPTQSARVGADRFLIWSVAGVAVTTVLSILLFVNGLSANNSQPQVGVPPLRPNPYVYLDKILQNSTKTFPPIINFPQVVLQIDNADKSRTMREHERGRATAFGTVYPDDRRVLITDSVSAVVQFRNLDYAMENCVLNISLPVETARFHPDINLTPTTVIDVWTLEDSAEFAQDIRGGAAARAPARRTLLATLPFPSSGSQQSGIFRCPSGAFTTLELACAPRAARCFVDFWQDRRAKPVGGVHIIQYSTPVEFGSTWS
ncbi:hypothetical protein VTO73DRAFT_8477 [Trametes versicolor]